MKRTVLAFVVAGAFGAAAVGCGGSSSSDAGHDGAAGNGGRGGGAGGPAGRGGSSGTMGLGGTTGGGSAGTSGAAGTAGTTGTAGTAGTGTTGRGGTSGSGATCDGSAPCGGDLVGTWNFVSLCVNEAVIREGFTIQDCPEATITNVGGTQTGSITFTATEYAVAASLSLSYTLTLPDYCLNGVTCDYFGGGLTQSASIQSASCAGDATCVCQIVTTPSLSAESGTYTTSGSTVNVMPTGRTPDSASYCVESDRLHILDVETITSMGAMTMRTRTDRVAQRQ
ncbi:MAG TPA: hypothetical protein VN903_27240 [Polyangia bacterium]|jgi:hypothetical protein|nr:hypothetical protein [Polyangia bacterium]